MSAVKNSRSFGTWAEIWAYQDLAENEWRSWFGDRWNWWEPEEVELRSWSEAIAPVANRTHTNFNEAQTGEVK